MDYTQALKYATVLANPLTNSFDKNTYDNFNKLYELFQLNNSLFKSTLKDLLDKYTRKVTE